MSKIKKSGLKRPEANCIVYVRDGYTSEFRAACLKRSKKKTKPSGDLMPSKSARAFVAAFHPALSEEEVLEYLREAERFLAQERSTNIEALRIDPDSDEVRIRSLSGMSLATSDGLFLQCPESGRPTRLYTWGIYLLFGSPRNWREASDDIRCIVNQIHSEGLVRGHLAAPWGVIEVIENDAQKLVAVLEREGWSEADANCNEEFDVY